MITLTVETLRDLARAQGLELTERELGELLPLVQGGRALLQSLSDLPLRDVEPSSQYRIL